MTITYVCPHCRTQLGRIDRQNLSESELGLQFLTPEERRDIISYNPGGEMVVSIACEYCSEARAAHPELALVHNPLQ